MIGYVEGATQALEDDAKGIWSLLWNCYPNHPWAVYCRPGHIFIKHLEYPGNWGMSIRVTEFDHDAAVMKKKIIMLAGEWLERASVKRGVWEDQDIQRVEGVPDLRPKPLTDDIKLILSEADLRDKPRPQAVKNG